MAGHEAVVVASLKQARGALKTARAQARFVDEKGLLKWCARQESNLDPQLRRLL
jgi:hypothetical protein